MKYALLAITVPDDPHEWHTFVNNAKIPTQLPRNTMRLAEDVWLVELPDGMHFLAHALHEAKFRGMGHMLRVFADAPVLNVDDPKRP